MEDGCDLNASGECASRSNNGIAIRRMKNRERQRRYRGKKRLETENMKSGIIIHQSKFSQAELQPDGKTLPTFSQEVLQPNGNLNAFVTRILCKRKWKKDARKAHKVEGHSVPAPMINNESQAGCISAKVELPPEMKIQHGNSFNPTTTVLGRRDWKSEARNKMN